MQLQSLPAVGQPLEGGVFAGVTTKRDGTHCAVVLLPDVPPERVTWKKAMSWAAEIGAELPARPVSALLFANVRDQVEADWYWTSEELDGSYAWSQSFGYGGQNGTHESWEGRARAVRLIPLTA